MLSLCHLNWRVPRSLTHHETHACYCVLFILTIVAFLSFLRAAFQILEQLVALHGQWHKAKTAAETAAGQVPHGGSEALATQRAAEAEELKKYESLYECLKQAMAMVGVRLGEGTTKFVM